MTRQLATLFLIAGISTSAAFASAQETDAQGGSRPEVAVKPRQIGASYEEGKQLVSRSPREGTTRLIRVPDDENWINSRPANLARVYLGASIAAYRNNELEEDTTTWSRVVLTDDDSLTHDLTPGQLSFIVNLDESLPVDSAMFTAFHGKGTASISVSETSLEPESPKWVKVGQRKSYAPGQVTVFRFPLTNAKYVKYDMNVASTTQLGNFGIFGSRTISDYNIVRRRASGLSNRVGPTMNQMVSSLSSGSAMAFSRIIYVSSSRGDLRDSYYMIDDDPDTYFEFAQSDPRPTVVVRFESPRAIRRVSTFTRGTAEDMDFFPFNSLDPLLDARVAALLPASTPAWALPGSLRERVILALLSQSSGLNLDIPDELVVKNSFFADRSPVGRIPLSPSLLQGAANTASRSARYLIMRLEPTQGNSAGGARVHEVNVFTNPFDGVYDPFPRRDFIDGRGTGQINPESPPQIPPLDVLSP